jgi:hypothetical protein
MKKILIISILIFSNVAFGQIPGKTIEGPIILFDTLSVKEGDILYLGNGSDPKTGNFIHLYSPKNTNIPLAKDIIAGFFSKNTGFDSKAIPQKNLDKDFAGKQLAIKSFSKISSKKKGKRILGFINMKEIQLIEDAFFNDIVVDFELALQSGEITKISAPELLDKEPRELLFSPFIMTSKGIEPVIVVINNLNKNELYNKTFNWVNSYNIFQNKATISTVPNEMISVHDIAENIKFSRIMGLDLIADLPYLFSVEFKDGEITMAFTLGGENGDILDVNGEVIANISPSHMYNKNGEIAKMSQVFKIEAEKLMNDISNDMVNYLMK